jgi:hypothetical protein
MAEVTYFVALPFVASDDGVAAGEPTECFNPNAAVMHAEALSRMSASEQSGKNCGRNLWKARTHSMPFDP